MGLFCGKFRLSLLPVHSIIGVLLMLLTALPSMGAVPQSVVTYTVTPGDSFFTIAKKFGVKLPELQQANFVPAKWLIPGEVLIIPGEDYLPPSYTVQSGDSLFLIANKYGVTVSNLIYQNNLDSIDIIPKQVLSIPAPPVIVGRDQSLQTILTQKNITIPTQFQIVVGKSSHTLTLFAKNILLKSYPVALGDGGPGAKQVRGDHKTPEGFFYIVDKTIFNPADEFLGTRWIRLGYPNIEDAARGFQQTIIAPSEYQGIVTAFDNKSTPPQYTRLGGGVGIHGGDPGTGNDWTWGCVGLADKDIEDFYPYINVGTQVIIKK
jgi:LysM repeat protein